MIDLLVAGGGPVGLGTALLAARRGLRVVVAEPRRGPIDKACGEGLMPGAVEALAGLGVHPAGRPFVGIRYVDGPYRAEGYFRSGPGLGVRRTALHTALSDAVTAAGIEVIPTAVEDVHHGGGCIEARLAGEGTRAAGAVAGHGRPASRASIDRVSSLRARYVAVADGLHSSLRERLGLALPTAGPRRYGLRRHFRVQPWSEFVEVHWSRGAEAYVTPVADDDVGVAVLFTGRGPFDSWLDEFPELRERLAGTCAASGVRGAGPLRQRTRRRVAGRALLVGDAAGYVDAITGEGIRLGLEQGKELVRSVAADRPDTYERAWLRSTREYRLLSDALVRAGRRPWLRSRIVPAAGALPWAFGNAIRLVAK